MFYVEQGAHSTQLCRIKKSQPKCFFIHLELSCVSAFPNSQLPSRDEDFHGGPDLGETQFPRTYCICDKGASFSKCLI